MELQRSEAQRQFDTHMITTQSMHREEMQKQQKEHEQNIMKIMHQMRESELRGQNELNSTSIELNESKVQMQALINKAEKLEGILNRARSKSRGRTESSQPQPSTTQNRDQSLDSNFSNFSIFTSYTDDTTASQEPPVNGINQPNGGSQSNGGSQPNGGNQPNGGEPE